MPVPSPQKGDSNEKKKGKRKEEAYGAIKRVKTKSSVKNRM